MLDLERTEQFSFELVGPDQADTSKNSATMNWDILVISLLNHTVTWDKSVCYTGEKTQKSKNITSTYNKMA